MAYVEIPLTKGYTTLVDCVDAPLALQYNWHLNDMGYAVWRGVKDGKKQTIRLHRLIAQTPDDLVTDHINHDRLDNRRNNLRAITQSGNMRNMTNQGKGYWYHRQINKWAVEVYGISRGVFDTEQEAADFAQAVREGRADKKPKIIQTTCKHGHSLDDAYEYNGHRYCRPCQAITGAAYFKRKYVPKPKAKVTICPRGHDKTVTATPNGDCRECAKIRAKQHYRRTN